MARARSARHRPALVALIAAAGSARREIAAASLLGLTAFLLVVGPAPLDVTNIAWLAHSDAATNYLGWGYFRAAPWNWPPAANPDYGLDLAGSIMMADANPLLALPFKAIGRWLPMPFQYFGWWLLGCFLLQALFARAIAARISDHAEQRLAITALFLFAPCFLIRIATPAIFHITLCGQWQILAALWLYLSPALRKRALAWAGLLMLGVLTHPYLLVIVAAIWLADVMRLLLAQAKPPRAIVAGAALAVVAMAATAKLSGVFWLRRAGDSGLTSYGEWGFGLFKANLLSPIDPEGWSWLLPDLPTNHGEREGFAFLGLGVLLLAVAAIALGRRAGRGLAAGREHGPLIVVLLGFALFAVSQNVAIGRHVLHVPWPGPLLGIGNLFRSSGRFAWPLVYSAMIAICWAVARGGGRRLASALLIAAALVQVADGSAGWRAYAATFAKRGPVWPTSLRSPFWQKAAGRYRAVRMIVPRNQSPLYRDVDAWALAHRLKTDIVYLARVDVGALDNLTRRRAAELGTGRLARDSLWIADGVPPQALAHMPRGSGDFVGTVDGIPLYAPGFDDLPDRAPPK